jgi:hypothetical protein
VWSLPSRSPFHHFSRIKPVHLPLNLREERWEPCPGLVRVHRSLEGCEIPVTAQPDPGSGFLVISDEPERVGPELGEEAVLNRFTIPGRGRVRILAYHVNQAGAPPRSFALFIRGARVVSLRGVDLGKPGAFRGANFSGAACASLSGTLPPLPFENSSATILLQRDQVSGTGDPCRSFFGGLVEAVLEGGDEAEVVTAFSSKRSPSLVEGEAVILPPNCGEEQFEMVGHPRGAWPASTILGPLPEGTFLLASPDPDSLVQFTLGQGSRRPYGGDIELFRGEETSPFGRANRGLYCVTQRISLPLRNLHSHPSTVRGFLLSLAQRQSLASAPDSKLFAGLMAEGQAFRIEAPKNAHLSSQAFPVFEVPVPGRGEADIAFEFQMGVASSGPVGLFLQGVSPQLAAAWASGGERKSGSSATPM